MGWVLLKYQAFHIVAPRASGEFTAGGLGAVMLGSHEEVGEVVEHGRPCVIFPIPTDVERRIHSPTPLA